MNRLSKIKFTGIASGLLSVAAFAQAGGVSAMSAAPRAPIQLQTQLRRNPVAVNSRHPQFGWVLPWAGHGQMQSAYEILAASSQTLLAQGKGDLWDSGKIKSDDSQNIRYAGRALTVREKCFWEVRVWNQSGKVSSWSRPAHWREALPTNAAWHGAQWIGLQKTASSSGQVLHNAHWIWYPEGQPAQAAPPGWRYFRRVINLPTNIKLRSAAVTITADNAFDLTINRQPVGSGSDFNHAYSMVITRYVHPGRNIVTVAAQNQGSAPNPAGLIGMFHFSLADGHSINVPTNADWQAAKRAGTHWKSAMVLGGYGMGPWGQIGGGYRRSLPARYLRRDFIIPKSIKNAIVYFSGLGWSKLYINGHTVSRDELSPALSWYPKRCYYRSYNVTRYLVKGRNTISVILGNGRFYAPRRHTPAPTIGFGVPRLMLLLHVRMATGASLLVRSGTEWKATTDGPITANNEYDGETYDARKRMPGWDKPGFNASAWRPAVVLPPPGGRLISQFSQPIQVTQIVHPVKLSLIAPGKWMFDMGQNMAGWCRIRVPNAPAGTTIVLRHGESLTRNGKYSVNLDSNKPGRVHLFVANLRSARQTDTLILNGHGPRTWHPIFTTHGFRFVEMTGFPGTPSLSTLEGQEVHDALPVNGGFSCSDPLVNRIFHNWRWDVQNNYRSIPSDCPQRDERQGWMGDRSEESKGEMFVFNNERFYQMWLDDMQDGQLAGGSVCDVNPPFWPFYNNSITWPGTFVFLPYSLYTQFGRISILRDHYAAEAKWVRFELGFVHHGITAMDNYGDWCSPPRSPWHIHSRDPRRSTPGPLLASVTLYQILEIMSREAGLLNHPADQTFWLNTAAKIKSGINRELWNSRKQYYGNGSDTSCILPLAAGVVPPSRRVAVIRRLLYRVNGVQHGHVGTGLVGGQWLFRTLTNIGQSQAAWRMLNKTSYPGWGFMVRHGATTLWELWNGNTANPAMNSQDHVMLTGDMITWLFEDLAGIKSDLREPGFGHIIMKPRPLHGLAWVKAWHRSAYGRIVSNWKVIGTRDFRWHIVIPANSTATVEIPASSARTVRLANRKIPSVAWIKYIGFRHGRAIYRIGSGDYDFSSVLSR